MFNISKFVKEHLLLSACTLGIAILGYLGYRTVQLIITKCQRTEKVDYVAHKTFNTQDSSVASSSPEIQRNFSEKKRKDPGYKSKALDSKSFTNRRRNLDNSPGKITMGQGEYIVFHKLLSGEKKELTPETFEQVYKVLIQYSPGAIINRGSEKAREECANRSELIKAKLKEIDPTLEAIFVPKTLYELIFIRKCIQEDLKQKKICPRLTPSFHTDASIFKDDKILYEEVLKEQEEVRSERKKCWHVCYLTDFGDNEHVGVKDVAYRLNKVMLKAFNPSNKGFTHQEFSVFAEKEIEFLKNHYKKGLEINEKLRRRETVEQICSCNTPGPTTNFCYESTRGSITPMGIRHETDAQMIRDAIALDCSKIAEHSFFLYRGTNSFQKDSVSYWGNKDKAYSLSYGSSLFAGCVHDGAACSFQFMRNQQKAYAISVPFDQLNASPFFIPTMHTISQLFSHGEIFHGRTKAWKDFDVKEIHGINAGGGGHNRNHLISNLNKKELIDQFQTYKNNAFQLK